MKISLVAAALPPQLDGIGDYTAHIAAELAKTAQVTVLVPTGHEHASIAGTEVIPVYSLGHRAGVWGIERHVHANPPDWLVLQYNPFSFGRRGLNLSLPRVLCSIAKNCPHTRLAVMVHEAYMPLVNWKFAIMTTWQRLQFWQISRAVHMLFFSVTQRAEKHRRRFPGKPMIYLPVGSNIPLVPMSREQSRQLLGIDNDVVVLGIFGTFHPERLFGHVKRAAEAVAASGRKVTVLYLGPHEDSVRSALAGVSCVSEGRLHAADISRRLSAVDVFLAPYEDGISTRRTTMMVGLQHGLPMVATRGYNTDPLLLDADGSAFLLAEVRDLDGFCRLVLRVLDDAEVRRRIACGGPEFFEANFSWPVIAARLLAQLNDYKEPSNENRVARVGS